MAIQHDRPGRGDHGRPGPQADWAGVVDDWRRAYQPAMDKVRQDATWRDLDSLHRETLPRCSPGTASSSPPPTGNAGQGPRPPRPWPEAGGLDRRRRGHLTATLSNGHLALLADLLKFGDLRVDAVLSAQLAASYKPDPKVYLTALHLLDCPPPEAGMVAAHPSDLGPRPGWAFARSSSAADSNGDPDRAPDRPACLWTA